MKQALHEIAFVVPPDAEEAVSFLIEQIVGFPPTFYTDFETQEMRAFVYFENTKQKNAALKKIKPALSRLKQFGFSIPVASLTERRLKPQDWAESWKRHFPLLDIAGKILIKPSWIKAKPKKGQVMVVLDPGLSFGTGHHATTGFCLEQLARLAAEQPGLSLLDAGTGSGILAIAAAKLGFKPIVAFDFDPQAVAVAKNNAASNGVTGKIKLGKKDLTKLPLRSREKYNVVCANLLADLLIKESARLVNFLEKGGTLIAAGILRAQFPAVQRKFRKHGLRLVASRVEKEWRSGAFLSPDNRPRNRLRLPRRSSVRLY